MLLASFIGVAVSISAITFYSFGLFIVPWQEEFGWSRAAIGGAQTVAAIVLIIAVPLVGRAMDRFGLKRVLIPSMILFAGATYLGVFLTGDVRVLYVIMVLVALSGAGGSPVAFTRAINGWFAKNRGLALGITLMSTGIMAAVLPAVLTPYIADNGWRSAMALLSVIILVPIVLMWVWIKDSGPEDSAPVTEGESAVAAKDQMSTLHFKKLALMFFLIAVGVCGLIPSFVPMLLDAGVTPEAAGQYTAIIGLSVMIGRLCTGFLVDRIFAPYVTAVVFSLAAVGLLIIAIGGIPYAAIGAVALGFAIGAEVDLIGYYTARYFGTRNYGFLFGILYGSFSLGCAASPLVAGMIWDQSGNYDVAFGGAAVLLAIAVAVALTLPRFEDPKHG